MTTVFIISAPSGSGKSTLARELMGHVPNLRFSVSYTTRAPRGQERERPGLFFHLPGGVRSAAREGEFLEYAEVFGHYYGTHRELERARRKAWTWCSTSMSRVRDN